MCEALFLDNKDIAVDLLIKQNRMADAIILALSGGPELLAKAQSKYFEVIFSCFFFFCDYDSFYRDLFQYFLHSVKPT